MSTWRSGGDGMTGPKPSHQRVDRLTLGALGGWVMTRTLSPC